MNCKFCNNKFPTERAEFGYDFCIKCSEIHPELSRPEYVVMGQHKGQPLVFSTKDPIVLRQENTMRR